MPKDARDANTLDRVSRMLPKVHAITASASQGRSVKASMASCTISSASTVSKVWPELHGSWKKAKINARRGTKGEATHFCSQSVGQSRHDFLIAVAVQLYGRRVLVEGVGSDGRGGLAGLEGASVGGEAGRRALGADCRGTARHSACAAPARAWSREFFDNGHVIHVGKERR